MILGLAIVLTALVFPALLTAGGSFENVPASVPAVYDFQTGDVITESIGVNYYGSFGVGFSAGGSGDYDARLLTSSGSTTLEYRLVDSAANGMIIKDLEGNPTGANLLKSSSFGSTSVSFDLSLSQGTLLPPGSFLDQVTVTLYSSSNKVVDTAVMGIDVTVPPYIDVVAVDPGSVFDTGYRDYTLDFGLLDEGTRADLDLLVRANVRYATSIESANNGLMLPLEPTVTGTIPYVLEVGGSALNLSGGAVGITEGMGPTLLSGDSVPLSFVIGDTTSAGGGVYEDRLTVVVTMME